MVTTAGNQQVAIVVDGFGERIEAKVRAGSAPKPAEGMGER